MDEYAGEFGVGVFLSDILLGRDQFMGQREFSAQAALQQRAVLVDAGNQALLGGNGKDLRRGQPEDAAAQRCTCLPISASISASDLRSSHSPSILFSTTSRPRCAPGAAADVLVPHRQVWVTPVSAARMNRTAWALGSAKGSVPVGADRVEPRCVENDQSCCSSGWG